MNINKRSRNVVLSFLFMACLADSRPVYADIVVNSVQDMLVPPAGEVTLRSALAVAANNDTITFDSSLDGATLELTIVGSEHSFLKGEVMGITNAPSGPISYLIGYEYRDYGRSALYAYKNVNIDATALTNGITIAWGGGDANPARVLAVLGNLTMRNVSVTGGRSVSVELPEPFFPTENQQLSTRARGGGLAVWGSARLYDCRLYDNACSQAWYVPARDRDSGVFGGGLYADEADLYDCVISGNRLTGVGVSGGGVFSVGGAEAGSSSVVRTVITGNRIAGIFAYGGGIYSDGGGIGNAEMLTLHNCTIADNLVGIYGPSFLYGSGYWRGGGVYISNGNLDIRSCTIVENEVHGVLRTDELGKSNLAGGVSATIGNAHAVDFLYLGQSIVTGNTVHEEGGSTYDQDIFTGSLFAFHSRGYNRIGVIDFSQILVPVGEQRWYSLCRKHFPKEGDEDGVVIADVLELNYGKTYSKDILSAGVSAPNNVVLNYAPRADAVDKIPASSFRVYHTNAEYTLLNSTTNTFLAIMLQRLESKYKLADFASTFTASFESFLANVDLDPDTEGNQSYNDPSGEPILTLSAALWYGPVATWPSQLSNYPYIEFWHQLDMALIAANITDLGTELLGDDAWMALFDSGPLTENPDINLSIWSVTAVVSPLTADQNAITRPQNGLGDVGAIEFKAEETLRINIDGFPATGLDLAIHWNSTPDRRYTLWRAPSLISNHWSMVDSGITSTIPVTVYSLQATNHNAFFKVEME